MTQSSYTYPRVCGHPTPVLAHTQHKLNTEHSESHSSLHRLLMLIKIKRNDFILLHTHTYIIHTRSSIVEQHIIKSVCPAQDFLFSVLLSLQISSQTPSAIHYDLGVQTSPGEVLDRQANTGLSTGLTHTCHDSNSPLKVHWKFAANQNKLNQGHSQMVPIESITTHFPTRTCVAALSQLSFTRNQRRSTSLWFTKHHNTCIVYPFQSSIRISPHTWSLVSRFSFAAMCRKQMTLPLPLARLGGGSRKRKWQRLKG